MSSVKKKIKDLKYEDFCEKYLTNPFSSCLCCPLKIRSHIDIETRNEEVDCKRDYLDKYGEQEIEVEV